MLVLELALKDQVAFTTKVTLSIELRFVEVKNMLLFPLNLSADCLKVLPRCFGSGEEFGHGQLTLHLRSFFLFLSVGFHYLLDSVEHEVVIIILVAVHLVEIKLI